MAKKSKKVSKPKPRVVVVNPWTQHPEEIAAWFSIMLKDDFPDAQVNIVFHRNSNGSKIVEFSPDVNDISMCLGTHYFASFLKNHRGSPGFSVVYEYKNSYAKDPAENNWAEAYVSNRPPPPTFPVISPYPLPLPVRPISEFYVDQEYACPPSAANLERMERRRQEKVKAELAASASALVVKSSVTMDPRIRQAGPVASGSASLAQAGQTPSPLRNQDASRSTPGPSSSPIIRTTPNASIPLSNTPQPPQKPDNTAKPATTNPIAPPDNVVVKKMDPYEEAEVAEELLRSLSPMKRNEEDEVVDQFLNSLSSEEPAVIITKEEDRVEDFLNSLSTTDLFSPDPPGSPPRIPKPEPEDAYIPSEELMDEFRSLDDFFPPDGDIIEDHAEPVPVITIKPEPVDTEMPTGNDDDYQPSEEAMEMFMRQTKREYDRYSPERGGSPSKRIKTEERETRLY